MRGAFPLPVWGEDVSFRVQGKAEGPLPGSFTAQGSEDYTLFTAGRFRESFTITSGSSKILGRIYAGYSSLPPITCPPGTEIGPATLDYKIHGKHRDQVLITIIKRNDYAFLSTFCHGYPRLQRRSTTARP
jgi:hypothetical protein